ncbi:MAG: hypothetical protein KF812_06495 [Fimbriimonadaceae bacterium]|nr:hypothetical protein [Fimbriimonadaceae bacterium]
MSVVVIGAGGHARVVVDTLRMSGREIYGLLDADTNRHGEIYEGSTIQGGDGLLPELFQRGVTEFIVGIGSIGRPSARVRAYDMGLSFGFVAATAVHPEGTVACSAKIGSGTLVAAGAVINPASTIGLNAIVNSMALVEHDVEVGDHAHLAPGSRVLGGCRVGARTHIGAG